jgi:hypothetical protein
MSLRQCVALFAGILLAVTAVQAQTSMRVRGTITAVDGNVLSVKSRDGREMKITLADNVAVLVAKAIRFEDIKPGDKLGVTSMPGPNGMPVAVEVHYLPPGVPEGQGPWDLQPGSTMTNAVVAAIVTATGNRELTLQFQGTTKEGRGPGKRRAGARGPRQPQRSRRRRIRVHRRAGRGRPELDCRPHPGEQGRSEAAVVTGDRGRERRAATS